MIPMNCPSCGRKGTVPPDRMNTRMHCKKCDAVFHMDPSGRVMLGEPPSSKPKGEAKPGTRGIDFDPIGTFARKIGSIPPQFWIVILVVGVGYGAFRGYRTFTSAVTGIPSDLLARAEWAGDAWVYQDFRKLQAITISGMWPDFYAWMKKTRPNFADYDSNTFPRVTVSVAVFTEEKKDGGLGITEVMLVPPPPEDPKKQANPPYKITLTWRNEGGEWLLDGKQMNSTAASEAPAPPPAQ